MTKQVASEKGAVMNKRLIFTLAALVGSIALALPAGAATTRYSAIGSPYSANSQFDAVAALTLHEFPSAVITSADITAAATLTATSLNGGSVGTPALRFLYWQGFASGFTANPDGPLGSNGEPLALYDPQQTFGTNPTAAQNLANIVHYANSGGVYVAIDRGAPGSGGTTEQDAEPAIAIVHATTKLVTSVNAKGTYTMTWKLFDARYDPVAQDTFTAIAWS
jgi:hypothetical protein